MNVTEPIIHAALLGTSNRELPLNGFPETLEEAFHHIQEKAEDTETAFYRMSALAFAYHRAGTTPLHTEGSTSIPEAPEEVLPYFNSEVGELLTYLNQQRNRYLLLYAYRKASECHRLIPPSCLYPLIQHAYERNNPDKEEEQALLAVLTGRRGRWLLNYMGVSDWGGDEEEPWETASHAERKQMLSNLRKSNPLQGLALLQTELKNETAAHRNELIQCLNINLSKDDEPFLQNIMQTDRSSTVKETARQLLSSLPDSTLVQTYCEWLRGHLHKKLLTGWSYDALPFTPEMKQMGLEEVSPNKQEKDEAYLLRQLAERVPLRFWMEFFDCPAAQAAEKLAQNPPFKTYFNLEAPIMTFADSLWAFHTLKARTERIDFSTLLYLLTPEQREEINLPERVKSFYQIPESWFNTDGRPWGIKFSTGLLEWMSQNTYHYYPKESAERLALYFPPEMLPRLEQRLRTPDSQGMNDFCQQTIEYMKLKEKIDTLFNENK